jgi:hypothetical protein
VYAARSTGFMKGTGLYLFEKGHLMQPFFNMKLMMSVQKRGINRIYKRRADPVEIAYYPMRQI